MLFGFSIVIGILFLSLFKGNGYFDVAVSCAITLISVGFILEMVLKKKYKAVQIPLIVGYLLRVVLLYYDVYSSDPLNLPLVGGPLTSDALGFYNSAVNVANGLPIRYGGEFSYLIGYIFRLTGASRLWGEYIIVLFSIATMLVAVQIMRELRLSAHDKKICMALLCCAPNYIFLSVVFRRETIITCMVSLSLLYFLRWARGVKGDVSLIKAVVFGLIASLFHGGTGLIVVAYLGFRLLYDPRTAKFKLKAKNLIFGSVFLLVFLLVFSRYGSVFFDKLEDKTDLASVASQRDVGGSSYARYVGDSSSLLRMAIYSIPRILYFEFSPFPWQWRGVNDIITFVMSSCLYLYVLVVALTSLRDKSMNQQRRMLLIMLLLTALMMMFIFSWGVTNTGTATRHRDKFIVLYALILGLCNDTRRKKREIRKMRARYRALRAGAENQR